jgi:hypothetical protein
LLFGDSGTVEDRAWGRKYFEWFLELEVADGTTMYRDEKETKSALYLYDPDGRRIVCQCYGIVPRRKQELEDWTSVRWALSGVRLDLF